MNKAAIGVYDSGFGGLSVWRELRRLLPNESLIYLGDGKNCPYGGRSREEITRFATEAVERLVREGVKICKEQGIDVFDRDEKYYTEAKNFKEKWASALEKGDPYYNPNLSLKHSYVYNFSRKQ